MNRIFSLGWNRTPGALRVASELSHAKGVWPGGTVSPAGTHRLAFACVTALTAAVFATPAWSAGCTVDGVTYTQCTLGTNGGHGGDADSGGAAGAGSHPGINDGGAGGYSDSRPGSAEGASGDGLGGSGGDAAAGDGGGAGGLGGGNGGTSQVAGGGYGGGGGGLSDGGNGGGGGGSDGRVYQGRTYPGAGGGGGGGLGTTVAGVTTNAPDSLIAGGSGGRGGGYSPASAFGSGGGGGGGGAGVWINAGSTLRNHGTVLGGTGNVDGGRGTAAGGGGGVLMEQGATLYNDGVIAGGDVFGNSGDGGAGVASAGNGTITNAGAISGGVPGFLAGAQGDAVDLAGGGNTLTLERGYSFNGKVVSTSGVGSSAIHGGDTLALGGDVSPAQPFDLSQVGTEYTGFNKFEKTGSSTWVVTGSGSGAGFDGGIAVKAGTLELGSDTSSGFAPAFIEGGEANVDAGAKLSGTGTISAPTTVVAGATLSPGSAGAPGTLKIDGPLNMLGSLDIGIGGTGTGNFDLLDVTGDASFGSSSVFQFMFGSGSYQQAGSTFQFFNANSFLDFADASSNFSCSGLLSGLTCMLGMNGAGNGLVLTLGDRSVPEPGSLGMLGFGLLLIAGGAGWRRRPDRDPTKRNPGRFRLCPDRASRSWVSGHGRVVPESAKPSALDLAWRRSRTAFGQAD